MRTLIGIMMLFALSGCATYDWSFNKQHERAQLILDDYRHIQGRLVQGQLP